jgi:hypothetical protein
MTLRPALVADGLFARSGVFHVMPETGLKPLEELFRARVIRFLVDKGLLPAEPARMLRGWVYSGFNVHRGRRVLSREREDMERLAQYIIRNPFSVEKMRATAPPSVCTSPTRRAKRPSIRGSTTPSPTTTPNRS